MTLTQKQCEAFADILVLAMCIDGHFSLMEEEAIQKEIDSIGWDENLSPFLHISSSIARARDVAGSTEQVRIYLEGLTPLFADPAAAEFVISQTLKVLASDGTHADEGVFISQLKAILKI
ncbi:hypothetical protein HQ447_07705 [bacterium]|nr:hypothetical protein [bacterium]